MLVKTKVHHKQAVHHDWSVVSHCHQAGGRSAPACIPALIRPHTSVTVEAGAVTSGLVNRGIHTVTAPITASRHKLDIPSSSPHGERCAQIDVVYNCKVKS